MKPSTPEEKKVIIPKWGLMDRYRMEIARGIERALDKKQRNLFPDPDNLTIEVRKLDEETRGKITSVFKHYGLDYFETDTEVKAVPEKKDDVWKDTGYASFAQ